MSASGIFKSVGIGTNVSACEHCGSTSRVGRGLCLNCLLGGALSEIERRETLEAVLDEIDVRDAGWRIGNYQILEEIGRGGMGVIYRARQRHSRRIVALKRIRSFQAESHETLARFRREAEAAASLDHPNILPIYEVSETEDGLPFFSMKFAAGGSLLDVATVLRSEPRRSVALLAKVARGVHHAHTRGILHRDLKPGNILLDGCGEPLVSDFGLAKWLDTSTDLTRTLTIFGTPGYIAPEQAKRSADKLTPAADVYSLGAILFDLFTGRPPFLGEHALAVIQQAAEKAAPKLRVLAPSFNRDLETICARCLEREPHARYQSANHLAEDLERWLEGRPIVARPVLPSTRIWRWSRRNPKLVGTALVCLLLGAASIWVLRQAAWTRQISVAVRKILSPQVETEQSKLHRALLEYPQLQTDVEQSHIAQNRASIQERLYAILATRISLDAKVLNNELPKLADSVQRDPDAPIYERASAAYLVKDYPESERLSLRAANEAQKAGPMGTPEVIRALKLASLSASKSDEFARAKEHLGEAEKLTDRQRDPRQWADVQYAIANVLLASNEHADEAEKRLRDVIEVRLSLFGPEHRETLKGRRRLALSLFNQAKYPEMEKEYRELIKLDEKILGPEHPETLFSRWDLAAALGNTTKREEALVEVRRVLQLREKVLGPEHPETIRTCIGLTANLANLGRYSEAITQMRELIPLEEKVFGPEDRSTVVTLVNLGEDLAEMGEYAEAEATLRRALKIREKTLGMVAPDTLFCRGTLAMTLGVQGKYLEAEAEVREIVRIKDETVGADRSGWTRDLLAGVLDKRGKHEEAESQVRQALRSNEKTLGLENNLTLSSRGNLARNLWYQGKNAEAESHLRQLITTNERVLGGKVYTIDNNRSSRLFEEVTPFLTRTLLANTLRDQHNYAEAEAQYKEVIQLEEKVLGPEHRDTLNACYNYAYQLARQDKRNEAKVLAERAAKGAEKVLGTNDPNTREYAKFLEVLQTDQAITTPYMKFHSAFAFGKRT